MTVHILTTQAVATNLTLNEKPPYHLVSEGKVSSFAMTGSHRGKFVALEKWIEE